MGKLTNQELDLRAANKKEYNELIANPAIWGTFNWADQVNDPIELPTEETK